MLGFRRAFVWETDRQARKRPGGGQAADTPDGSCIFDSENTLVYTDGDWEDPTIRRVVSFDLKNGTMLHDAKSFFTELETDGADYDEIKGLLAYVYGKEVVSLRHQDVRDAAEGQDWGGTRKDAGRTGRDNRTDLPSEGKRKYALKKNVEQIEDLVAVHNTTADKLKKALDLLGFPTPSVAVTKTGIVHSNFGEITLTFGRGTVKLLPPGGGGVLPEAEKAIEPGRALFAGRLARLLRQRRAEKNERRSPSVKHFYESSVNKYCNYGAAMI